MKILKSKIKKNCKILDFGCGNGLCYDYYKIIKIIRENNLKIRGIDIDEVYINECKNRIVKNSLEEHVTIDLLNIFDLTIVDNEKYDYVIFCIGSEYNDFGINGVEKYTYKFKNKNDIIRYLLFSLFL